MDDQDPQLYGDLDIHVVHSDDVGHTRHAQILPLYNQPQPKKSPRVLIRGWRDHGNAYLSLLLPSGEGWGEGSRGAELASLRLHPAPLPEGEEVAVTLEVHELQC